MKAKILVVLFAVLLGGTLMAGDGSPHKAEGIDFSGYNVTLGIISWGSGVLPSPVPGGKIRGLILSATFVPYTTGPAADFLTGFVGSFTMNANLNEDLTGPMWAAFEYSKDEFTWAGTCNGQFNWLLSAGSWKCEGHISGPGLKPVETKNDSVAPGPDTLYPTVSFGKVFGLR